MKGNEAVGAGAILAGCRFYFGYPITPQNELTEYMSRNMPASGGTFIQSESELAAINMVMGASAAGGRAMTSSSSPGVSLMQEGISYMTGMEIPAVIVNVVRAGPGLGGIGPAQSDYFQAVKGGGHGDYRTIVLAPYTVQEMLDLTMLAFDLADKYRNPALILADGLLGQMSEAVKVPVDYQPDIPSRKDCAMDGCREREPHTIKSLILNTRELEEHNIKLCNKYEELEQNDARFESFHAEDADILITGYGTSARIAKSAVQKARARGIRAGLFRPVTLLPFPVKDFVEAVGKCRCVLVTEMNMGQMFEDIKRITNGRVPVHFKGHAGGVVFTSEELEEEIARLDNEFSESKVKQESV